MGGHLKDNNCNVNINIISNPEFGRIDSIKVFVGIIGNNNEILYHNIENVNNYMINKSFNISAKKNMYIRSESYMKNKDIETFAMTNPIWILPNES